MSSPPRVRCPVSRISLAHTGIKSARNTPPPVGRSLWNVNPLLGIRNPTVTGRGPEPRESAGRCLLRWPYTLYRAQGREPWASGPRVHVPGAYSRGTGRRPVPWRSPWGPADSPWPLPSPGLDASSRLRVSHVRAHLELPSLGWFALRGPAVLPGLAVLSTPQDVRSSQPVLSVCVSVPAGGGGPRFQQRLGTRLGALGGAEAALVLHTLLGKVEQPGRARERQPVSPGGSEEE